MANSIIYNNKKDIKINIDFNNIRNDNIVTINLNLYINKLKKLYEYEKILVLLNNVNRNFKIIGKSNKIPQFKVSNVGNICKNDDEQFRYNSRLCHQIIPYKYNYIHKNNNNDKYTIQNKSVDKNNINSDWFYVPILNSSSIESDNLTCNNNICEYFGDNQTIYSSIDYNIIKINTSDNEYLINNRIIAKVLTQNKDNKPILIVIDNSNLKKFLDYEIFITNDYIEFNKSNSKFDDYKLIKCDNNICNIKLNDTLVYGPTITDNETILDVINLHKFFINSTLKPNTDIKCYPENNDFRECYITNKNINEKKLSCKKINNEIKCNKNLNENLNVFESFENIKYQDNNINLYLCVMICTIFIYYLLNK
jgi:hypothetical protein